MNLSRELKERLESDSALLQRCAVHLLIEVSKTYSLAINQTAFSLGLTSEKVIDWLTGSSLPTVFESGMIFHFVDTQTFPIEWEIRGKILKEYDDEKRVPLARYFIRRINELLDAQGSDGEKNSRELSLLVEDTTLTLYEIGSYPGKYRVVLNITRQGEELSIQVGRIENKNDATVAGEIHIHLPTIPEALNLNTMSTYIPHADHTFTISDWEEMNRWLEKPVVVESGFYLECFTRSLERDYPRMRSTEAKSS